MTRRTTLPLLKFGPTTLLMDTSAFELAARAHERRVRPLHRDRTRVLMYHGLVESKIDPYLERNFHTLDEFRAHLRHLRHHRVIPADHASLGKYGRSGLTVSITFDDGYHNNLIAADLLHDAKLPWSIFISTGVIGTSSTIWTAQLGLLLLHGHSNAVDVLGRRWPLANRAQRLEAFGAIRRAAKALVRVDRLRLLQDLTDQFASGELERLLESFPSFRMLDWSSVRSLNSSGVTIGSHGVDHEILHDRQPPSVVRAEIDGSIGAIERELGVRCISLAFPNGDCSADSCEIARLRGIRSAFTTVDGSVPTDGDRLALPRIDAPGDRMEFVRALIRGQGAKLH